MNEQDIRLRQKVRVSSTHKLEEWRGQVATVSGINDDAQGVNIELTDAEGCRYNGLKPEDVEQSA